MPHPRVKNFKRIARVVVLPDYQGLGIGLRLTDYVANYWHKRGFRPLSTLSNQAIIQHYKRCPYWALTRKGHVSSGLETAKLKDSLSISRLTTSWEYTGKK